MMGQFFQVNNLFFCGFQCVNDFCFFGIGRLVNDQKICFYLSKFGLYLGLVSFIVFFNDLYFEIIQVQQLVYIVVLLAVLLVM